MARQPSVQTTDQTPILTPLRSISLYMVLLILISSLFFFVGLGTPGLTDRDEASFSEATREMIDSGDWLTPRLNGNIRFDKPILIYYIMAVSFKLFGISEWAARLHSAVFATMLLLVTFLFVRRHLPERVAFMSSVILGSNLLIVILGRAATTDMALNLTTTCALLLFFEGTQGHRRLYLAIYPLLALGFLIKGPVAVAIFLSAAIPYLLLTRKLRLFLREAYPIWGVIAFTAIALPWFAIMWTIHGTEYTDAARAFTLGRYFSTIGGHGGTIFFYIPVLLITFFPWVVWLPSSLWRVFRAKGKAAGPTETASFFLLFAAVWMVGGLIFFSISQTRMAHYIAPLYPAAAILVAQAWARLFENEHFGKWTGIFFVALGTVLGICFLSAPEILEHFRYKLAKEIPQEESLGVALPLVVLGALLLVGTAVSSIALFWRRVWTAFWVCHGMMLSSVLALVFLLAPRVDHLLLAPSRELAQEVGRSIGPQGVFIAYGTYRPSLVFYARHEVIRLNAGQDSEIDQIISSVPQTYILARRFPPEWTPLPSWGRLIAVNGPYLLIARP